MFLPNYLEYLSVGGAAGRDLRRREQTPSELDSGATGESGAGVDLSWKTAQAEPPPCPRGLGRCLGPGALKGRVTRSFCFDKRRRLWLELFLSLLCPP